MNRLWDEGDILKLDDKKISVPSHFDPIVKDEPEAEVLVPDTSENSISDESTDEIEVLRKTIDEEFGTDKYDRRWGKAKLENQLLLLRTGKAQ
jgi:hypothetical protein